MGDALREDDEWGGLDYLAKLLAPEVGGEVEEEAEPSLGELRASQISSHLQVDFLVDATMSVIVGRGPA